MSKTLVVIPARFGSTRFPGKVLEKLGRLPIVEWCRRAAVRADIGPVVVATEHSAVVRTVENFGGQAVLTSSRCHSGSDRVHEALLIVERRCGRRFGRVINLQGDEPLIGAGTIRRVDRLLSPGTGTDISTAVVPLSDPKRVGEPSVVKAVVARDGRCLYFSRLPVPFRSLSFFQHIGIYGFTRRALERFIRLPPSPLERTERLEQLRAMEAGMTIRAARVTDRTVAIDTPSDLRRAARLLNGKKRSEHG